MTRLYRQFVAHVDSFQQSHRPFAFLYGVVKKYGDDRGGSLSALITFYGFLAVFPLLLLLVTIVGIVIGPNSALSKDIVDSALRQFPIIGDKINSNIRSLSRGNVLAFVVSALGLLWGSLGVTNAMQRASATAWRVPRDREATMWTRILRSLALLGTMTTAVVLSSVLTGASTIGAAYFGRHTMALRVLVALGGALVNMSCYLLAFVILAPPDVPVRSLLPGTFVGGIGWTVLQGIGGYLIGHHLQRASELYGVFAVVLGLVFWLNLGSQLFLYSTEVNIVRHRHLWPRSLTEPHEDPQEHRHEDPHEGPGPNADPPTPPDDGSPT